MKIQEKISKKCKVFSWSKNRTDSSQKREKTTLFALLFGAELIQKHGVHSGSRSQKTVQSEHKKPAAEARSGRCEQSAGADSVAGNRQGYTCELLLGLIDKLQITESLLRILRNQIEIPHKKLEGLRKAGLYRLLENLNLLAVGGRMQKGVKLKAPLFRLLIPLAEEIPRVAVIVRDKGILNLEKNGDVWIVSIRHAELKSRLAGGEIWTADGGDISPLLCPTQKGLLKRHPRMALHPSHDGGIWNVECLAGVLLSFKKHPINRAGIAPRPLASSSSVWVLLVLFLKFPRLRNCLLYREALPEEVVDSLLFQPQLPAGFSERGIRDAFKDNWSISPDFFRNIRKFQHHLDNLACVASFFQQ